MKIFQSIVTLIILVSCANMKSKHNSKQSNENKICNFELITRKDKIEIKKIIFTSNGEYENVFFEGDFDTANRDSINFVHQCANCNNSCFKINLRDRLRFDFDELTSSEILSHNDIDKYRVAKKSKLFKNSYNMFYGGTPTYSFVKCGVCDSKYLIVVGLDEKQYGLYQGQAQGMWLIE